MMMQQIPLQRNQQNQILWVPCNKKLKAGNCLSLKEKPQEFWNIIHVWDKIMDKDDIEFTWHCGGL